MEQQLLDALVQRLHWDKSTLVVSALGGGLTNQNYRIFTGGEDYVARVYGGDTELLGIDRESELYCSRIAAGLGVGAEVFFAEGRVMVTRFISGTTLTSEDAAQRCLVRIIESLKKIHEGPSFPGIFSPFETVQRYARLATERGVVLSTQATEGLSRFEQLEATLWPPPKLVPCHHDLLAGNFIDDGKNLWIIDWEYAAMGDPFFDLGNFAANQELDQSGCQELLTAYFGEVKDEDMERLQGMKMASNMREAFWGILQSSLSKLDFDYLAYAQKHLDRVDSVVNSE
jgi:thiamine kinase-like enzyme